MNRKEWIEYFEAINNRKPTIQECQQALLNGEFVMEGKQATFSNNGKSVTEEVMPLPNQMSGQMVNPAYSQQMVFVKKKKFGKKTFIGLGIALFLVVATSLGLFLFSSKGTNLGGLWVNGNNVGLVYDLMGRSQNFFTGYREEEIKEISIGKKARQEFETSLEDVSDSKLKTIADFDKKYQLQTKEVILVKTKWNDMDTIICSEGWNKCHFRHRLIRSIFPRIKHQRFKKRDAFFIRRRFQKFLLVNGRNLMRMMTPKEKLLSLKWCYFYRF